MTSMQNILECICKKFQSESIRVTNWEITVYQNKIYRSLMDTNHSDEYDEFAKDPEKLLEHLSTRFEQMLQILDDDENFCNRDIKSIKDRVQIIENKFLEKTQELRNKLEQFRLENEDLSQKNKDQFIKEVDDINDLFSKDRYQGFISNFFVYFSKFSI